MKRLFLAATLTAALPGVALPSTAMAQDTAALESAGVSRASDILRALQGKKPLEQVFSKEFLRAVPPATLRALIGDLTADHGPLTAIDEVSYKGDGAAAFFLVFERARAAATLQLDGAPPYHVSGFRIASAIPLDDTPQKILQDIAALPGQTGFGAYLLTDDGPQPVLTNEGDQQLAIGSTFKLYVLAALAREIKEGKRSWADVVTLDVPSIPSGQMQDWPMGSPVTLHTLATMMISISDNTATDTLMRVLGREAVEAEVLASGHSDPSATLPLFTTVEFFALKTDPARVAAWKAADDAGQRALLDEWAPTLTADRVNVPGLMVSGPTAIDSIEWFASAEDIARIFARLKDLGDQTALDIMGINTVLNDEEEARWDYAGYKGGSETGVLNLSWLLKDRHGRWYSVSLSWNDPAARVDEARLILLSKRVIGMLQE